MTSAEVATLAFLRTALSNGDTSAVMTMNADGTLSMSIDIGPGEQQIDMPALQGTKGPSGQNQFPLMLMPDIYDSTADLPAAAVLTNTIADIGKFWIIYQTDSTGDVTSVGAYIWFGTEFRFLPFGAQGPPGPYPVIKPFIKLLGPHKLSELLPATGSGTAMDPYLSTLQLSIPTPPSGPGAPLASFYDVAAWQPSIPGVTPNPPLAPQPDIGDLFTYTGTDITPLGFADPVPLWSPEQGVNGLLQPYVVPQSAFNSYAGITFARTVTIATFTVPPQPFPWKPIVFGQIRMFEAELSFQPFLMGIEVRLGNPQVVLDPPANLIATVNPSGSILFTPGTYVYEVTAVIDSGETTPSTGVSVTAATFSNSVALSWDAVDHAVSYNVYRGSAFGGTSRLNGSPVMGTSFTDTGYPGSFTAPPAVNTAVGTSGTLVARGFGNTGSGVVTVVPHTSSPAEPDAAMNPWNDVGLVAANHGGPDGTLYINIVNDGLAAIWDYSASDAELFVLAAPATPQQDIQPIIPAVFSMKVTLSGRAPITAHLPLHGKGVLTVVVEEWPVAQEFRSTSVYTPPSWWISGTHYLDLIAVGDGGGAGTVGLAGAGAPGGAGSWATATIQTLSTGHLTVTIGRGGAGSSTLANGASGAGVTLKDGATTKLSAAGGAGGANGAGGALASTGWHGTLPGPETYLGQTYYGGVQTPVAGHLPASPATLYTFAATGAATFRPLFGDLSQFDMQVGEGVDHSKYNVVAIDYPGAHLAWDGLGAEVFTPNYTILAGCQQGAATAVAQILDTPGPFAFSAYSLGSLVASLVYNEIVSGALTSRAADFVGAVTFGSSVRQAGHTIPGGDDPGGHGCFGSAYRMTNTPLNWWDFANSNPLDPFTTVGDDTTGQAFTTVANAVLADSVTGALNDVVGTLQTLLPSLSAQIPAIWSALTEFIFPFLSPNDNASGHGNYDKTYHGLPNNTLSAVQLAVNYLNSLVTGPNTPVVLGPTYSGAPGVWPGGGGSGANRIFVAGGDGAAGAAWIVARKT